MTLFLSCGWLLDWEAMEIAIFCVKKKALVSGAWKLKWFPAIKCFITSIHRYEDKVKSSFALEVFDNT